MISSFVVTGFLGVGKTTLLTNSVKEHFKEKRIAIIVNEFGEVGVDGEILKNTYSEVLEISEGCICCKLAEEFEKGVLEIIQDYNPEIIFVETSGASEPFPIFLSLQSLGVAVEGIICVVDAKNFDSYKNNSTAKYQIGGSNIIVINKIDLVNEQKLTYLENEISQIKEKFNIKNSLTNKPIFKNYVTHKTEFRLLPKSIFSGIYKVDEIVKFAKNYIHHNHTSKDSIEQKVLYLSEDIEFKDVKKLLASLPSNVYRAKGIIKTTDIDDALIVNYVFGDISFAELKDYSDSSILILIGSSLGNI